MYVYIYLRDRQWRYLAFDYNNIDHYSMIVNKQHGLEIKDNDFEAILQFLSDLGILMKNKNKNRMKGIIKKS